MRFYGEKPEQQRRWLSEKGQSAVEFAIVVPVLALMLVAIADFARVFFVSVAVNNAARAGAQYGSQTVSTAQDTTGMQKAASLDFGCVPSGSATCPNLPNWSTPTASQCTCTVSNPQTVTLCASSYCTYSANSTYVTVNTSATFSTILNYPGIAHSYTLTGQAIMQVQANE